MKLTIFIALFCSLALIATPTFVTPGTGAGTGKKPPVTTLPVTQPVGLA